MKGCRGFARDRAIGLRRFRKNGDRRSEAIAAPRYVDNVSRAILPIAERATKRGDVDPNIGLFDERIGPDLPGEFSLVDNLTGSLDEDLQNRQGSIPDLQRS